VCVNARVCLRRCSHENSGHDADHNRCTDAQVTRYRQHENGRGGTRRGWRRVAAGEFGFLSTRGTNATALGLAVWWHRTAQKRTQIRGLWTARRTGCRNSVPKSAAPALTFNRDDILLQGVTPRPQAPVRHPTTPPPLCPTPTIPQPHPHSHTRRHRRGPTTPCHASLHHAHGVRVPITMHRTLPLLVLLGASECCCERGPREVKGGTHVPSSQPS
jgi:hypothetical protein